MKHASPVTGDYGMTLLRCFSIDSCMLVLLLDLGLVVVQCYAYDRIVILITGRKAWYILCLCMVFIPDTDSKEYL